MRNLTRFNKIAIQGTPQMAVDKEAIICLSRVYSYYVCRLRRYTYERPPLYQLIPVLSHLQATVRPTISLNSTGRNHVHSLR